MGKVYISATYLHTYLHTNPIASLPPGSRDGNQTTLDNGAVIWGMSDDDDEEDDDEEDEEDDDDGDGDARGW